jgi:hypothetical protein
MGGSAFLIRSVNGANPSRFLGKEDRVRAGGGSDVKQLAKLRAADQELMCTAHVLRHTSRGE